jgi:hypothetical protein
LFSDRSISISKLSDRLSLYSSFIWLGDRELLIMFVAMY